jgi:hypothetical protein
MFSPTSSAPKLCSTRVGYQGAVSSKVTSKFRAVVVSTNVLPAFTLRSQRGRERPSALHNDAPLTAYGADQQKQPYSSQRQESNIPTTIRESTNLVEHVLYVVLFLELFARGNIQRMLTRLHSVPLRTSYRIGPGKAHCGLSVLA